MHAVFVRAARRHFFGDFAILSRELGAKFARSRRWTLSFSDLNATLTRSNFSEVVKYAQRTLAECTQLFCAGRAGFPEILQFFRAIFTQNLRHLNAGLAHYLALERTPTQIKSCNEGLRFAQPRWPSSRNFFARGAPKFFGDFAILSRELGAKFA